MNKKENGEPRNRKKVFILYFMIIFILMFLWNLCTPLFDDDIYSSHLLWSQIPYWGIHDYLTWNGRIVGQSIMRCLQIGNPFFNALIFTFFIVLIWKLGINNQKIASYTNVNKLIIGFVIVFIAIPSFGQTILWRSGAGNYLWTTTIILLFSLAYLYYPLSSKRYLKFIQLIFLCLLGFIAGWCTENTSIASILVLLLFTFVEKQKINRTKLISLCFSLVGWILLIASPGNKIRTYNSVGKEYLNQPLLERVIKGIIVINKTILQNYFPLIIILVILFFIMLNFYFNKHKLINSLIWFIGGLAAIYSLSFSPIEQNGGRTYFGGIVFWIISLITLLPDSFQNLSKGNKIFLESLLSLTIIYFGITGFNGLVDSLSSDCAINQQYTIIENEKQNNKKDVLSVPRISYSPQTKYSIDYGLEQIGNNPNTFPNVGYNIKFGVKVRTK